MMLPAGMSYNGIYMSLKVIDKADVDVAERHRVAMRLMVALAGEAESSKWSDPCDLRGLRIHLEDHLVPFRRLERFIAIWVTTRGLMMAHASSSDGFQKMDLCALESPCRAANASPLQRIACGLETRNMSLMSTTLCHCTTFKAVTTSKADTTPKADATSKADTTPKADTYNTTKPFIKTVTLVRDTKGLGMKICTLDVITRVVEVLKGGVVEASGVVQRGDRIIMINDTPVAGLTHEEVVSLLTDSPVVRLALVFDGSPMVDYDDNYDSSRTVDYDTEDASETEDAVQPGIIATTEVDLDLVFARATEEAVVREEQNKIALQWMPAVDMCVAAVRQSDEALGGVPVPVELNPPKMCLDAVQVVAIKEPDLPSIRSVTLVCDAKGLGMRLCTTPTIRFSKLCNANGLGSWVRTLSNTRVVEVLKGGVAEASGVVQRGDRIITINGTPVAGRTHDEVVSLLAASPVVHLDLLFDGLDMVDPADEFVHDTWPFCRPTTVVFAHDEAAAREEPDTVAATAMDLVSGDAGVGSPNKTMADLLQRVCSPNTMQCAIDAVASGAVRPSDGIIGANDTSAKVQHDVRLATEEAISGKKPVSVDSVVEEAIVASEDPVGSLTASEEPVGSLTASEEPVGNLTASEEPVGSADTEMQPVKVVSLTRSATGFGMSIAWDMNGVLRVVSAANGTLQQGDHIIAINGTPTWDKAWDEYEEKPIYKACRDVLAMMAVSQVVVLRVVRNKSPLHFPGLWLLPEIAC